MKTTYILFALLMLFVPQLLGAQTQPDSTANRERLQKREKMKFIDENGDGIDDRLGRTGAGRQRGKDRFIDADGDGICDDRANGLGFRYGKTGTGLGKGSDGKMRGRRGGPGGNP
ncbi:MAG: hypothetical protein IT282_18430 [Bacteroidetes bacterium]|nr:hypothetical protein [Bacteroidota bacterium]